MRFTRRAVFGAAIAGVGVGAGAKLIAQPAPPGRTVSPKVLRAATLDPVLPPEGDPKGDVTVLELLDYNCPYCRRMAPELDALVRTDPKVRVLYTPWPIFGAGSRYAAQAVVAADRQGKALVAHHALIDAKVRLADAAIVDDVLGRSGVDVARLRQDIRTRSVEIGLRLARGADIAKLLGAQGTPMLLIGSEVIPGALDRRGLAGQVAAARRRT